MNESGITEIGQITATTHSDPENNEHENDDNEWISKNMKFVCDPTLAQYFGGDMDALLETVKKFTVTECIARLLNEQKNPRNPLHHSEHEFLNKQVQILLGAEYAAKVKIGGIIFKLSRFNIDFGIPRNDLFHWTNGTDAYIGKVIFVLKIQGTAGKRKNHITAEYVFEVEVQRMKDSTKFVINPNTLKSNTMYTTCDQGNIEDKMFNAISSLGTQIIQTPFLQFFQLHTEIDQIEFNIPFEKQARVKVDPKDMKLD